MRFLTSLTDAELSAAVGEMDLDDGESEGDSDSDAEDGEVVQVKTSTTGIQTGGVHDAGKKLLPTKRV